MPIRKAVRSALGLTAALSLLGGGLAVAAPAPQAEQAAPAADAAVAYTVKRVKRGVYRLTATGTGVASRTAVEQRLAYKAAQLTIEQRGGWFELVEEGAAKAAAATSDGKRYSFRMQNWRPAWRFKSGSKWQAVDLAAGQPAPTDPAQAFEASVTVAVHEGRLRMSDAENPRAFDAWAVSDYLKEQVEPPQGAA